MGGCHSKVKAQSKLQGTSNSPSVPTLSLKEAIEKAHSYAQCNPSEWTAVCYAIELRHLSAVEALVREGNESVNVRCSAANGGTALHLAASKGLAECLTFLLKASYVVTAVDFIGDTPLHCSAIHGHAEAAKVLIEKGGVSLVNTANNEGLTALHISSGFGHLAFVLAILNCSRRQPRSGVDIHASNNAGKTALHFAAINGDKEVVRALLEYGAKDDILKRDQDMKTPIEYAEQNGNDDVADMLLEAGAHI